MNILKLKKGTAIILIILFLIPFASFGQENVRLRLKLQEGQKFDFIVGTDMKMKMSIGDTTMKMDMTARQLIEYKVFTVKSNGDMEIGMTPKSYNIKMEITDGENLEYDSENPNLDDERGISRHGVFSEILSKTVKMTMNPTGKITDYSGFEQIFNEIIVDTTVSEEINEMSGDELMKELMQQFSGLYPEEALNIGDSWEVTLNWKEMGIDITYDYTLLEIKDGKAKIGIEGKMDFDLGEAMAKMTQLTEEMGFEYEIIGKITGSFELNTTDGWIDNMEQNMIMDGTMKMKLPEDASEEEADMEGATIDKNGKMVIPITLNMLQTMKRQ